MDAVREAKVNTEPGMAFTCHNTGVCCRAFETIPADRAFVQSLGDTEPGALGLSSGGQLLDVVVPGLPGDPPRVARQPCGNCVMLHDNLCAIHKVLGARAKPQVCQDFPYRFVETPGGVFAGLSFACPSVRGNRGALLSEQTDQIEAGYGASGSVRPVEGPIRLSRRVLLSWDDYVALEESLLELLACQQYSLARRLVACCVLISFIDKFTDELLAGGPVQAEGTRLPDGQLHAFIAALRATEYRELFRAASRPVPNALRLRRMFLGMFVSFGNTLDRKRGRLATVSTVMAQYFKHATGVGRVQFNPIGAALNKAQLDSAVLPGTGESAALLQRYAAHCIWRKDLLLSGSISRRLRLFALSMALVPWYASAEAERAGRAEAGAEDWSEAVFHVERLYGFHSKFFRFFEKNKAFDDIVESFILKPRYPFIILQ